MYCVKCGVELANSESKCPLCHTPVYYPDRGELSENYPKYKVENEVINPKGLYFVLSFFFAIAAIISLVCDIAVNDASLSWSIYVVGALVVVYMMIIFPFWFNKRTPAIFVPVDFVLIAAYLWLVSFVSGGDWYFGLALPITGVVAVIVSAVSILLYYIRRGRLYILGGTSIALGVLCALIELFIHLNYGQVHEMKYIWSVYPFIAFFLIGIMLIIIAIVKPLRESLRKILIL